MVATRWDIGDHRVLRAKVATTKLEKKITIRKPTKIEHIKLGQNADKYRQIQRGNPKPESETEALEIIKSIDCQKNESTRQSDEYETILAENPKLNKLIRGKSRDLRKSKKSEIEKVIDQNRDLNCLPPHLGK